MSDPVVSVIMPAYNAVAFIGEAIESVLVQNYPHWELVLIDDHSSDGTVQYVREHFGHDLRIRILEQPGNLGAAHARNRGLAAALGRYIAFLDADDQWLPNKLEYQLAWMVERACPFSFTAYQRIDSSGRVLATVGVPSSTSYEELLGTCVIGCSTVMIDRSVFGDVRMPALRKRQDFACWLLLLKRVPQASGINQVMTRYMLRPGSISANKFGASAYTWRVYREVERLPLGRALRCMFQYACQGFFRRYAPLAAQRLGWLRSAEHSAEHSEVPAKS